LALSNRFGLARFSRPRTWLRAYDAFPISPAALAAAHAHRSRQDENPRPPTGEREPTGAGCRDQNLRLPSPRRAISLDIPFHRTVSYDQEEERITEVFVRENSGNEAWELVGRLLSLLLRSRVEPDRILKQLYRTRGQSTIVLNGQIFSSIAQALASTLESAEKHFASPTLPFPREEPGEENLTAELEEETEVPKAQGTACPMCARYTFVPSGGCKTCLNCGYSTCGGTSK